MECYSRKVFVSLCNFTKIGLHHKCYWEILHFVNFVEKFPNLTLLTQTLTFIRIYLLVINFSILGDYYIRTKWKIHEDILVLYSSEFSLIFVRTVSFGWNTWNTFTLVISFNNLFHFILNKQFILAMTAIKLLTHC